MKTSIKYREAMADVRRIVVKVGTRVLAQDSGRLDQRRMRSLVKQLAIIQRVGHEVVLVTSGAIGAGMDALGMKDRPTKLPDLQMAAAVGQGKLMACYDALFSSVGCHAGQVLLTHDDFQHKLRYNNARRTIENLIRHKVIPIINENDVVADEEIKADIALGDNDFLASLVVKMIRADLMVLLSTTDGLRKFDARGRSERIPCVESFSRDIFGLVKASDTRLSKGGMDSKLRAARAVADAGCMSVIADGRNANTLVKIMQGKDVGTLFLASSL